MTARTYNELFDPAAAVLVLERESDLWWTVTSLPTGDVMMRADRELCVRFMRAFVVKHPEASIGLSERGRSLDSGLAQGPGHSRSESPTEHSWRVAQEATSHDRLATVYTIRPHEPLDESA